MFSRFAAGTLKKAAARSGACRKPWPARGASYRPGEDKRKRKEIEKQLKAAERDLDAASRLLVPPPNVLAAFHLQQAAEKILGAVRVHRGLHITKDHDIAILIDGRKDGLEPRPLPPGDVWRERFLPLESLSAYATAFRYNLAPPPRVEDLREMLAKVEKLHALARQELLG